MEGDTADHSSQPRSVEAEAAGGSRSGVDEKPATTGAEVVVDVPDPDEDDLDDLDGKFPCCSTRRP